MLKKDYEIMAKYYDFLQQEMDYQVWLDFFNEKVDTKQQLNILEIGCGTGKFAELIDLEKHNYIGFDLSKAMVGEANAKGLNAEFICADARDFKFSQKFDVIICFMDTINYLVTTNDIRDTFKNISEHLKPNGKCLFDIHLEENLYNFADYHEIGYIGDFKYEWLSKVVSEKQKRVNHYFEFTENDNVYKECHKQKIESKSYYEKIIRKYLKINEIKSDDYRYYFELIKEK